MQKALLLFLILSFSKLLAAEIPIIVIAPSKKAQSLSAVGSSVVVYDENDLSQGNDYFLRDVLSNGSSMNFNQSGGTGTVSGIQLRGLPKAYSTVYIDGIKMSDNSTPKNDYYFDDILSSQISRVEILKGNQSSVYGSGAMGGTINITTKKGQQGFQKKVFYNTGSHGTQNLSFSFGGANEVRDFYVGLERYTTDGISAMSHNDEKDGYKNHTLIANYGYNISDTLKFTANYRFVDAKLEYDSVEKSFPNDDDKSHEKESSGIIGFLYKPNEKFTNNLTLSNAYISRTADNIKDSFTNQFVENNYWSYRNAFNYNGIYNFNLDNSVVFGLEKEWNEMDYEKLAGWHDATDDRNHSEIFSQYIDFQSRLTNNLYATFGLRFDEHDLSGNEDSERISLAYLFDDKNTKLKTSYGTGIKFPALFEFYSSANPSSLVAEHGRSFDFGIEKSFPDYNLNIDLTYFNHMYEDTIEGWKSASWLPQNRPGKVKAQGIELLSNFKINEMINFYLNYTYNSTYDGADFDDPDMGPNSQGLFTNEQIARVPRHLINLNSKLFLTKKLDFSLHSKWSDSVRDYNNVNVGQNSGDKRLSPYMVNDLSINYNIGAGYKAFLKIDNIFDKDYSTALEYNQMDRAINFGMKRVY